MLWGERYRQNRHGATTLFQRCSKLRILPQKLFPQLAAVRNCVATGVKRVQVRDDVPRYVLHKDVLSRSALRPMRARWIRTLTAGIEQPRILAISSQLKSPSAV